MLRWPQSHLFSGSYNNLSPPALVLCIPANAPFLITIRIMTITLLSIPEITLIHPLP